MSRSILAIETASDRASLAVVTLNENGSYELTPASSSPRFFGRTAENLFTELEELDPSIVDDLAAIVVCLGPGSYTGTRTGMAAALGVARAKSLPVVGISIIAGAIFGSSQLRHLLPSFRIETLAEKFEHRFVVSWPANANEFYVGERFLGLDSSAVNEPSIERLRWKVIEGISGGPFSVLSATEHSELLAELGSDKHSSASEKGTPIDLTDGLADGALTLACAVSRLLELFPGNQPGEGRLSMEHLLSQTNLTSAWSSLLNPDIALPTLPGTACCSPQLAAVPLFLPWYGKPVVAQTLVQRGLI